MKKTYGIRNCLTDKQIEQFGHITKKLLQSHHTYGLVINAQWKINILNDTIQLQLLFCPLSNYRIKINPTLPSICNIKQEKQSKIFRLSDRDSLFHKITSFIDNLIKKNTTLLSQYKEIQLDLAILGYFRISRGQIDYHNRKGLLKWSLISHSQGQRLKLDEIAQLPDIQNINKFQEKNLQNKMNRKFSSSSFKQYDLSHSLQKNSKQKSKTSLTKSRQRINSLPSVSNEQAKQNHKKVLNNIQKIKQIQKKIEAKKVNYLKIDEGSKKRRLSINNNPLLFSNMQKIQAIQSKTEQLVEKTNKKKGGKLQRVDTMIDLINMMSEIKQSKDQNKLQQDSSLFSLNKKSQTLISHNQVDSRVTDLASSKNTAREKQSLQKISNPSTYSKQKKTTKNNNKTGTKIRLTQKLKLNDKKEIIQYENVIQYQEEQIKKQQLKNSIAILLTSNQDLVNDSLLIQELYEITKAYEMQRISQNGSRYRNLQQTDKLSYKLSYQELCHLEQTIDCKHKNNIFIQTIIKQTQQIFEDIYIKSFKTIDCSDKYFIKSLDRLSQSFQLIKMKIKAQIEIQVQDKFQRQAQSEQIKQKFNQYKYSSHSKQRKSNVLYSSILDEVTKKRKQKAGQEKVIEDLMPETNKSIMKIVTDYQLQKYESMENYYFQSYYMPYFYFLGIFLSELFVRCFQNIGDPQTVIYIELKDINKLEETISANIACIMELYNKFISFFEKIPHKMFRVQQIHLDKVKNLIQKRKKQLYQCQNQWQIQIKQAFQSFQTYLQHNKKKIHHFTQEFRKCSDKIMLPQRQQNLKQMEQKYQKLIGSKTYFKSSQHILDTNIAKIELMDKYQRDIGNIYKGIYVMLCSISLAWSQEMARTQRLMADQLAQQEAQISAKIRFLSKNYTKLLKILFLQRKYYYFPPEESQNKKYSQQQIALKQTKKSVEIRKSKELKLNNQFNNKTSFSDLFYKCLNSSYNMCKKNDEKIIQISFLVQKHREKMIYVSRLLEQKEKDEKKQSEEISNQLRKILREVKTKFDVIKIQHKIKQIQGRFKIYKQRNKKLHDEMTKNGMIIWQQDDFLESNINICLRTINFMDSEIYMRINYNSIDSIRFQHFYKYYKTLEKLISAISGHKFQELFKNQYDLTKKQFEFIEMVLYKDYNVVQIEQIFDHHNLDLRPTLTTMKLSQILKILRSKPTLYRDISKIYFNRKRQKYNKNLQKNIIVQIQTSENKEEQIAKILNYQQIKIILTDQINHGNLPKRQKEIRQEQLQILGKIYEIYQIIYESQLIMMEISSDLKQEQIVNIIMHLDKVKLYYHNALNSFKIQKNFNISHQSNSITDSNSSYSLKQWQKLVMLASELENYKIKNKLYIFLSQLCPRLIMVPFKHIIHLMDWSNHFKILKNMKILFSQVIDVQFGDNNSIVAIYVSRQKDNDRIQISSGPIYTDKQDKKGKLIRRIEKQVHRSLLSMISNSIGRAGQIKILHWHLYFTQQVQQSIITNSSLKILQSRINDTICSIKCDLRYDVNNHKDLQISQLNTFYHYIADCLGQFPRIDAFQWTNTIRAYQKKNCVMIQQNNLEFYYGFQPKSARTLHTMNWNLSVSVSYGDHSLTDLYKYKAYIIGSPYFEITQYKDSYLSEQKNIQKYIQLLEINKFICTIVEPDQQQMEERSIFNQIHKEILNYINQRMRRLKINQVTNEGRDKDKDKEEMNKSNNNNNNDIQIKNQGQKSLGKSKNIALNSLNESKPDNIIDSKGRFSVHLCYKQYVKIPPCFLSFYRCRNLSKSQPCSLPLKINLILLKTKLTSQLKQKLIWKLIKLMNAVNQVRYSSYQQLSKLITKIVQIVESYQDVTKEAKNQIYCYITQNYISDYGVAGGIVNQVFKVEEFANQFQINSIVDSKIPKSSDVIKPGVTIHSRKSLIEKLKKQYEQIKKSNKIRKPVIIFGQQPTCKSTFIQQELQFRLDRKQGYIQASLLQFQINQEDQLDTSKDQSQEEFWFPYRVVQAGSLGQISPSLLSMCHLLYVPSIPVQHNIQYKEQLKQHFSITILNTNSIINSKVVIQKLWNYAQIMYYMYALIQKKQQILKINFFLDQLLKLYCYFLSEGDQTIDKEFQVKIKSKVQLFVLLCFQLLIYSMTERCQRRFFVEEVKKFIHSHKADLKLEDIQSITYSKTGEIIKFDTAVTNKQHSSGPTKKQFMFLVHMISREIYIINRYIDIGFSVCLFGNSLHMFRQVCATINHCVLSAGIVIKNQFKQFSNRNFVLSARLETIKSVYNKLGIIYEKKRQRLNISKAMVSGKIMELSVSRNYLQSSQKININFTQKTIIFVDDLHMDNTKNKSELAAILNRLNNPQSCRQIEQIFILFKRNNYKDKPLSNRLRRFTLEITLPDIQFQTIFKYRSQYMMNEEQYNLPSEIYNVGLFNQNMQLNDEPLLVSKIDQVLKSKQKDSKNESKRNDNEIYIDFSIETIHKMSSQLYLKYIMSKISQLSLSAFRLNYYSNSKPKQILKDVLERLQKSQLTLKLTDKLIPKTISNFFIISKNQKYVELDWKVIHSDIQHFLNGLPLQKKIIGQIYAEYLPLIISARICIIKSDNYNILTETCAFIQQKTIGYLTHNFFKQICQHLTIMYKNKQKSIILIIPEYLLYYPQLTDFIRSVVYNKQILIENKDLFEYWWEFVSEQEFIQNRYDQYQTIKRDIQEIFLRISFFISVQNITLSESVRLLSEKYQKQNESTDYQQQIKTFSQKSESRKKILSTNISKHQSKSKKPKTKKERDLEYYKLKDILLINTQLTLEEQIHCINKMQQYYLNNLKPPQQALKYIKKSLEYLKLIVENSFSEQLDTEFSCAQSELISKEETSMRNIVHNNKQSYIFFEILEIIPNIYAIIIENFKQVPKNSINSQFPSAFSLGGTMMSIAEQQKLTLPELIQNLNKKLSTLTQKIQQKNKKLNILQNYHQRLIQLPIMKYQFYDQINSKKLIETQKKAHKYINEQFSKIKMEYLQNNNVHDRNWNISYKNHQQLKDLVLMCFQPQREKNSQFLFDNDFVVESSEGKFNNFKPYIECQVNFVRFAGVDDQFRLLMFEITEKQYSSIRKRLLNLENYIQNITSFIFSLDYAYKISQFFKKHLKKQKIEIDNVHYQPELITEEYKFIEYMNILNSLSICNQLIKNLKDKIQSIQEVEDAVQNCINFLVQISSLTPNSTDQLHIRQKGFQKNYDLTIKLKIYEMISNSVLAKMKRNLRMHYQIHRDLQLQSTANILFSLEHPKLMYPYKWQQIQNQIFIPLIQNRRQFTQKQKDERTNRSDSSKKKQLKEKKQKKISFYQVLNCRRLTQELHRVSIDFKKQKSQNLLKITETFQQEGLWACMTKYAIVHDPFSQFTKYLQSGCQSVVNSYRKIVYLKNYEGKLGQCTSNNEKLMKLNHISTFFIYYFKVQLNELTETYKTSMKILKKIIKILNQKDQKGQGQNDRLIILVQHNFLCRDLKQNAQFIEKPKSQAKQQSQKGKKSKNLSTLVQIVSLQPTQMDILQYFKSNPKQNQADNNKSNPNQKERESKIETVFAKSKLSNIRTNSVKNLQNLHNEYNMSKNYLKILMKSVADRISQNPQIQISQTNLPMIMKVLQQYQSRKTQLLNQYCSQKLFNYDYFLDYNNLSGIWCLYEIFIYLLVNSMVPMDFISNIGNYLTIQSIITNLFQNQQIRNSKAMKIKSVKGKSVFYEAENPKRSIGILNIQKIYQLIVKHFKQYKNELNRNIYYVNKENSSSIRKQKLFHQLIEPSQIFILIYDNFQNWIIKELIERQDRNRIKLIFDNQPNCYDIYLQTALTPIKQSRKIIFLVNQQHLIRIKKIMHAVKIFWL